MRFLALSLFSLTYQEYKGINSIIIEVILSVKSEHAFRAAEKSRDFKVSFAFYFINKNTNRQNTSGYELLQSYHLAMYLWERTAWSQFT